MSPGRPTIARQHARFAVRFLAPLLGGGDVVVSHPIPPVVLDDFVAMAIPDAEAEGAIARGLDDAARALLGHPSPPVALGRGAIALALAAHDLAAATDPMLDRALARAAIPKALGYAAALVEAAGPVASREDALARHAVVRSLGALDREDHTVRLWFGGSYAFPGRDVPPRLRALPKLRRVREEAERRPFHGLFEALGPELGGEAVATFEKLCLASPLTDLVSGDPAKPCHLGLDALTVLGDPVLARAVTQAVAAGGLPSVGRLAGGLVDRRDPGSVAALRVVLDALALLALDGGRAPLHSALGPFESFALGAFAAALEADAVASLRELSRRDRARLVAFATLLEPRGLREGIARGRALVHRTLAPAAAHASENRIP
ncbi:MAG: hypothetical protein U0230_24220 [Polyangiales bacterium]